MTWPEAIYKIIVEGGGGLLTAIVLVAMFTDFFEGLFGSKTVYEIPEETLEILRDLANEMKEFIPDSKPHVYRSTICSWAAALDRIIDEDQ